MSNGCFFLLFTWHFLSLSLKLSFVCILFNQLGEIKILKIVSSGKLFLQHNRIKINFSFNNRVWFLIKVRKHVDIAAEAWQNTRADPKIFWSENYGIEATVTDPGSLFLSIPDLGDNSNKRDGGKKFVVLPFL